MNLTVDHKTVYGNELFYPVCNTGEVLLSLIGKKTFNRSDINKLKSIGYVITIKTKEI